MQCSEKNFVTSQCMYAVTIAYPFMKEDDQIEKAIRMADKIIDRNYPAKKKTNAKRKTS